MERAFKIRYILTIFARIMFAVIIALITLTAALWRGTDTVLATAVSAGAFVAVALIAKIPSLLAPGWDGVVTGKTVRYTTIRGKQNVPEYELTVTDGKGREHFDLFLDKEDKGEPNRIEYYDNGERVRRHRGFKYYEKFNKSGKSSLICIGCGKLSSKEKQRCQNCGLPLLSEDILS